MKTKTPPSHKRLRLTMQDQEWIETKRAEIKRLRVLFKGRPWKTWDVPRAVEIIDKLLEGVVCHVKA